MYRPLRTADARPWGKLRFMYLPSPPPHILASQKHCLQDRDFHTLHIILSPFVHNSQPLAIFRCSFGGQTTLTGCRKGTNYMQALCQAVYNALTLSLPSHEGPFILWLQPKTIPNKLLMLAPLRDSHVTFDIQQIITNYLTDHDSASVDLIAY